MDNIQTYKDIQNEALQKFNTSSWPSQEEEEWRRTNLSKFSIDTYTSGEPNPAVTSLVTTTGEINDYDIDVSINADGKASALFSPQASESGVRLSLLSGNELPAPYDMIRWSFDKMDNKTGYYNFTRLGNALLLDIPGNVQLLKPVRVQYTADKSDSTVLYSLFINAGKNSEAEIIEKVTAAGERIYVNSTSTLFADMRTRIKTAFISDVSDSSIIIAHRNIRLGEESTFLDFQNFNGSKLSKGRTEVDLADDNITANLYGTVYAEGTEHFDIRTIQNHHAHNGKSKALLKSIVKEKGRTIFQGLINVGEHGALTDAYLTNNNIILNDSARADSIPALKIQNNDVKCSHGSTTGKIDPHQVFYLTSRGLSHEEAKSLILEGFLNQVYDVLPESFTNVSLPLIENKLSQVS